MKSAYTLPLILACPAIADFIGLRAVVAPGNGDQVGMVVSVYAAFESEEEVALITACAGIPGMPATIAVENGLFYQHRLGSDTAPNQALVDIFPSLALDTFVTIGARSFGTPSVPVDAVGLSPGWPGFEPDALFLEDHAWFVTPDDPQAHIGQADNPPRAVLIGQYSVSFEDGFGVGVSGVLLTRGETDGVGFQQFLTFHGPFCELIDIDDDGMVNTPDLLDVITQWGPCEDVCTADFRGDGVVSTRACWICSRTGVRASRAGDHALSTPASGRDRQSIPTRTAPTL